MRTLHLVGLQYYFLSVVVLEPLRRIGRTRQVYYFLSTPLGSPARPTYTGQFRLIRLVLKDLPIAVCLPYLSRF